MPRKSLLERDARVLWHPYTQHACDPAPLPVVAAEGTRLLLEDGREVLDAISSWWTVLHGHGHPALRAALTEQAARLDHVVFAGATHEPAVALAEELLAVAPPGLARVFYSDDGSTAVEVALKLALLAQRRTGRGEARTFVALEGAYHGDTFGAMAVGDPEPFFEELSELLFAVRRVPPEPAAVRGALRELGTRAAGLIVEPLVQGAGGMRMHGPELLVAAREACDGEGVPLIVDEVLTGFGRTGTLFACEQAGIAPDLLCLAKGLTGGILPLSATLASERVFDAFLDRDRSRAFFHGHSFTANPLGCAVARASLALCRAERVPQRLDAIGRRIEGELAELLPAGGRPAATLRRRGGIVAFDLEAGPGGGGYLDRRVLSLRERALALGVLLRPLGSVLYAMPPASATEAECSRIAHALAALAEGVPAAPGPERDAS